MQYLCRNGFSKSPTPTSVRKRARTQRNRKGAASPPPSICTRGGCLLLPNGRAILFNTSLTQNWRRLWKGFQRLQNSPRINLTLYPPVFFGETLWGQSELWCGCLRPEGYSILILRTEKVILRQLSYALMQERSRKVSPVPSNVQMFKVLHIHYWVTVLHTILQKDSTGHHSIPDLCRLNCNVRKHNGDWPPINKFLHGFLVMQLELQMATYSLLAGQHHNLCHYT